MSVIARIKEEVADMAPPALTPHRRVFDLRQAVDQVAESTTAAEEREALIRLAALAICSAMTVRR